MLSIEYRVPSNGLGTDFTTNERPLSFAETYTNRFRNVTGGAERRPGMNRWGSQVSGGPNLTRLHEFVDSQGNETLLTSDDNGNIWSYNTTASAWSPVVTGKSPARIISVESNNKLIFINGVDRNFYTSDVSAFPELKSLLSTGILAAGSNATTTEDGNITNWLAQTQVANNDIVYNVTLNAYGIVSTVASAALETTIIGAAGIGAGNATRDQAAGDSYQLIDYVDMEIIPNGAQGFSNVATATTGTTTSVISVSGVNFSQIAIAAADQVKSGDFVYNTTRGGLGIIGSVSANVNITTPITGQTSGDALAFFKSAMPITSWVHVHYGRTYYLDSRNQADIIISAPDDPQDLSTYQQTLATTSFSFGSQQPSGDVILSMTSFQRFFVASGLKNLYIYQGINPIADTSQTAVDFTPISFYPNGVKSPFGLGTNGTDLLHLTVDGLQAINIGTVTNTTIQNNVSMPIRETLSDLIQQTNTNDIQLGFYSRRNWLICKIGQSCYILNSYPSYDEAGNQQSKLSWHLFSGKWAQQNHYFVRRNGDLFACGANGLVYQMDSSATTDDGTVIVTDLVLAWVRLEEPQHTVRIKEGFYIRPIFESDPSIEYTINVNAGLDNLSQDSITVSAGGTGQIGSFVIGTTPIGAGGFAQTQKYPLRWRGEQAQIEFITSSSALPDIITSFVVYGDITGTR